jgi:flavodoxin
MEALVIYDSLHGNTEKIAYAICDGLRGGAGVSTGVELIRAGDVRPDQLTGINLLLVGAPTHGSQPSPPVHDFLNRIPDGALRGVKVAAFDTRTDMDKQTGALRWMARIFDRPGYAAPKIAARLERKGGQVVVPPEGFIVLGTEGPLEDGELERARNWAGQLAALDG